MLAACIIHHHICHHIHRCCIIMVGSANFLDHQGYKVVHSCIEVIAILNTTVATFISLEAAVALLVSKRQSYCLGEVVVEVQYNDRLY
jgi:hypothetical protein